MKTQAWSYTMFCEDTEKPGPYGIFFWQTMDHNIMVYASAVGLYIIGRCTDGN
jgi:hypothetical protein